MGEVDWDEAPLNERIWCVYGPECFPTVFACMIKDHPQCGRVIWGYSVYRRAKGFRTLGQGVEWMHRNDGKLFVSYEDASRYIEALFP